ncbi:phage head-tail joining protein [Chitinibacteraceae bacterium HSL-7]
MVSDDDIAALRSALALGERVVVLDNKRIEYRSVQEIEQALNRLLRDQAAERAAGRPVSRQIRLYHGGRGY